jgi:hypothetical protein
LPLPGQTVGGSFAIVMNDLGDIGWSLISFNPPRITDSFLSGFYIFKREP